MRKQELKQQLLLNLNSASNKKNHSEEVESIWEVVPEYLKKSNFSVDFDEGFIKFEIYKVYSRELQMVEKDERFIEVKNNRLTKSFKISFEDYCSLS